MDIYRHIGWKIGEVEVATQLSHTFFIEKKREYSVSLDGLDNMFL